MNTAELEQYMLNDPYIRHFYGGVLGRNELPLYMKKTKIYIVNTDPIDEPGTHWTAFYLDRIAEYFDSIASIPEQDFKNFLILNGSQYKYNSTRLQDYNSNFCGHYTLMYSYFKSRGYNLEDIIAMFSSNLKLNDSIVKTFYESTN